MIEGVLKHCTDMKVEKQFVDTHGQSEVAFAFCRLLGFELMPRLKSIASQKLYLPDISLKKELKNLLPILNRGIKWEIIERQYDEMVKYTAALEQGTADPESILKRFTRGNESHPIYRALQELGKAVKTIFLCRYLADENVRREIHGGLNVIENWNSANGFIFFGKSGEVSSNRLEEQELSVLALHLLQNCLVYVNTLMIQRVVAENGWMERFDKEDYRALSPLIHAHVNPYGKFELDMDKNLGLAV
jgi:TnpA family transposase